MELGLKLELELKIEMKLELEMELEIEMGLYQRWTCDLILKIVHEELDHHDHDLVCLGQ